MTLRKAATKSSFETPLCRLIPQPEATRAARLGWLRFSSYGSYSRIGCLGKLTRRIVFALAVRTLFAFASCSART